MWRMSNFQNRNPLDIQVNFADPLDIHLQFLRNPLDIQIDLTPWISKKIIEPLDIQVNLADPLDIRQKKSIPIFSDNLH